MLLKLHTKNKTKTSYSMFKTFFQRSKIFYTKEELTTD